jgi:hypothetical protein
MYYSQASIENKIDVKFHYLKTGDSIVNAQTAMQVIKNILPPELVYIIIKSLQDKLSHSGNGQSYLSVMSMANCSGEEHHELGEPKVMIDHEAAEKWYSEFTPLEYCNGGNLGGYSTHIETNTKYYIKFQGKQQAHNEFLANSLYRCLGVMVPKLMLVEDVGLGLGVGVASEIEASFVSHSVQPLTNLAPDPKHIIIDAWLANWDVVGSGGDNIGSAVNSDTQERQYFRIDQGGTLLFRANGCPKNLAWEVQEIEQWLDPNNSFYQPLFAQNDCANILKYAENVGNFPDHEIFKQVLNAELNIENSNAAAAALVARKGDIIMRYCCQESDDSRALPSNIIDLLLQANHSKGEIINSYEYVLAVTRALTTLNFDAGHSLIDAVHLANLCGVDETLQVLVETIHNPAIALVLFQASIE